MITYIILASILFSSNQPSCTVQDSYTISNEYLTAVVTSSQGSSRAGSLLELVDIQTGVDFAEGGQYGSVHCGDYVPLDGSVVLNSASCATFISAAMKDYSTGLELPIAISTTYRLTGRALEITYQITATGIAELSDPLEADFGLKPYIDKHIKFRNQTVFQDRWNELNGNHNLIRVSGDQIVFLYSPYCELDATYIFPNPSKAILAVSADDYPGNEYLSLRFFDTTEPFFTAGPDLHSLLGPGNSSTYYMQMSLDSTFIPVYFSTHPNMYERTASWILDEIPMLHPQQGDMWSFSETSSDSEYISAWVIQLLEDHPEMKMNILILGDGILEQNCDSMWYEPGWEHSWSHWHSTWRIATEAPEDFKQWMINIQNDYYPWADRVNLGFHGYHHTPSPDSAWDPFHEFITFELEEHQERMEMIWDDFSDIGLDPQQTMHSMRPAGNSTSLSALWAMIDHGTKFYSNGVRWSEWMAGEWFWDMYLSRYETQNGRMWGTNTCWWADYSQQMPCIRLSTVMDRGKHALLGGHPGDMWNFGHQFAYDRIDSLCSSLEDDYSNFGWLFPVEYAEFMEESFELRVDSIRNDDNSASIFFTGATSTGQTLVARLPSWVIIENVLIDGEEVLWEDYGDKRIFLNADGLDSGSHQAVISWFPLGISQEESINHNNLFLSTVNPSGRLIRVTVEGLQNGENFQLQLFDIMGRMVTEPHCCIGTGDATEVLLQVSSSVSEGMYFLHLQTGNSIATDKVLIIGD
ncbi:MAG: T9SS type A sorting domain-containing protein [Candidatus Fermentibacteria bacterium]